MATQIANHKATERLIEAMRQNEEQNGDGSFDYSKWETVETVASTYEVDVNELGHLGRGVIELLIKSHWDATRKHHRHHAVLGKPALANQGRP